MRKVHFGPISFHYEDPHLSKSLKLARQSNEMQRLADRARLETTIAPILNEKHREKIRVLLESIEFEAKNTQDENS